MKKTVYLDSTIPSYYFDEREGVKFQSKVTKKWKMEESKNFTIYISQITLNELSKGSYPNKDEVIQFAHEYDVLPATDEIGRIAEIYIDNYLMPKDFEGDAVHLAYASYYKMDYLLTWNCNHLANANKKQHIRIINTKLNLSIPEIITPMKLFCEI